MKICFSSAENIPVTLLQKSKNRFIVKYGQSVSGDLSYEEAAKELGASLMHRAACEGKLDNGEG